MTVTARRCWDGTGVSSHLYTGIVRYSLILPRRHASVSSGNKTLSVLEYQYCTKLKNQLVYHRLCRWYAHAPLSWKPSGFIVSSRLVETFMERQQQQCFNCSVSHFLGIFIFNLYKEKLLLWSFLISAFYWSSFQYLASVILSDVLMSSVS